MSSALFDAGPYFVEPEPAEPAQSAEVRRGVRQARALAAGLHPLTVAGQHPNGPIVGHLRLHAEAAPADDRAAPGRRCGNCWYRRLGYTNGNRKWPKCTFGATNPTDADPRPGPPPRITHGAGSDVRAWWPGCTDHSYGAPSTSDDAARWVPS